MLEETLMNGEQLKSIDSTAQQYNIKNYDLIWRVTGRAIHYRNKKYNDSKPLGPDYDRAINFYDNYLRRTLK